MKKLLALAGLVVLIVGCSHNPNMVTAGNITSVGSKTGAGWHSSKGLNIIDLPRENSSYELEFNSATGIGYDPSTGTVKGVEKIKRKIGPQVSGYLVDLAKASPEAAIVYLHQAFQLMADEGATISPQQTLLELPIPVAHSKVTVSDWLRVNKKANELNEETVPEGLDMDLEEWIWLKAAYLECPECLLLSEEEEAIIKKALGIE